MCADNSRQDRSNTHSQVWGVRQYSLHCRGSDLITRQTQPDALQDRLPISQTFASSRDRARKLQPPS